MSNEPVEDTEDTVDQLALIKEDVEKLLKRAQNKNVGFDTRTEFKDNAYPVLLDLIDALKSRFDDVESVLAEYLEPTESLVMPDFAEKLSKLLAVGGRLAVVAKILSDALGGAFDDVTAARVSEQLEGGGTLDQWVAGYVQEAQNAINELSSVTFEDEDDEDDDEDDGEDDTDEDADEEEEAEVTK